MKKTLYIFNPENDMALASGSIHYMAPGSAKKMAADLDTLLCWYAVPGSAVLLADARQAEWMKSHYPFLSTEYVTEIPKETEAVVPWGWSPALKQRLRLAGVADNVLPSDERLARMRALSSRALAVELLPLLRFPGTVGESCMANLVSTVIDYQQRHGKIMVKAPWSSSGKGVFPLSTQPDESKTGWIKRVAASQGGVVVEPFYPKQLDFAMEFLATEEGVRFAGYSVFQASAEGMYSGNLLRPDKVLEEQLTAYVPKELLQRVREALEAELSARLTGVYSGYLGVDMMIVASPEGGFALHPCVEVNLRMTMGMVARLVCDRWMVPGSEGVFCIRHFSRPGEALAFAERMREEFPPVVENGRLVSGYFPLVPVFEDTMYLVDVF